MSTETITASGRTRANSRPQVALTPSARRTILCIHIVASVGLLGEVAGFLVVAIRAAADPALADASYELLSTFTVVFGIPLSMTALASGIALGLGTKWGVLRYPWVMTKLALIASVVFVGALVLGPSVEAMRAGGAGAEARIIAGAAWDVITLSLATALSIFKPGRRRQSA